MRRFLELIDLVWKGSIEPGKIFDLPLPLEQVAEGYRAMDERRAIKALPRPQPPPQLVAPQTAYRIELR